jgi:hypothetical protein
LGTSSTTLLPWPDLSDRARGEAGLRASGRIREAAVAITLELYLEHQIIRGSFKDEPGQRPIDLLNSVAGGMIGLSDAWSASLHVEAPPVWLDAVRVRRSQILMVIAQNTTPLPPRRFRVGFVEKRPLRAVVGLGPFSVAGTMHVGSHEQASVMTLEHDVSGRFFIPVTEAQVRSQYHPRWLIEADLMFVNRAAISYSYAMPNP